MIIELLVASLPFLMGAGVGIYHIRNISSPQLEQMRDITQKLVEAEKKPSLSETAELVVELFKEDTGWQVAGDFYEHETGVSVRLRTHSASGRVTITVSIANDDKQWKSAEITREDSNAIAAQLKAFDARRRDREQEELRRALAKRIIEREAGTLRPLLGGPGVDGPAVGPAGAKGNPGTPATAGLLAYDHATDRIIKTREGDSVRLELSEALEKRYGVAKRQGITIYDAQGHASYYL